MPYCSCVPTPATSHLTINRVIASVFESGRFETLFGSGRGGGVTLTDDPRDDCLRSHRHPGPMCEVRRLNGRLLRARIIRYGDRVGSPGERIHDPERGRRIFKTLADNYLVEFMEEIPAQRPDSQAKWPNGFPCHGHYYVGTLRKGGEGLCEDGLTFCTDERSRATNLPGSECARLLAFFDEQLG